MSNLKYETLQIDKLIPYVNNQKKHPTEQVEKIMGSIKEFGVINPIIVDKDNVIIAGHGRYEALKRLEYKEVPILRAEHLTPTQVKAYRIADNKLAELAVWDDDLLAIDLSELDAVAFDMDILGFDEDELNEILDEFGRDIDCLADSTKKKKEIDEIYSEYERGSLADKFGVPPFSVFDCRSRRWFDRKRYWVDRGLVSNDGREELNVTTGESVNIANYDNGGSVFDPVLCELGYTWFSKKDDIIFDPFAGGSVRGVMASWLDRQYFGIDIRKKQIDANIKQLNLVNGYKYKPQWLVGDSAESKNILPKEFKANLVFSCPPYVDLEVYSGDDRDLSNMDYVNFLKAYKKIIQNCFDLLNDNRFAIFAVGEVRDKKGNYYNFVGDTIRLFLEAGFKYYNEIVILSPIGSLPLRAKKPFLKSRKVGKAHQNFLVFLKGNSEEAVNRLGDIILEESWDNLQ